MLLNTSDGDILPGCLVDAILHCFSKKNTPTLASCSFDKHSLILIIFGQQHQHTFKSDVLIQLSLSLHFYLLYWLLDSCNENEVGGLA